MFLSLELPGGDKGVSIFARDLKEDRRFDPTFQSWSDPDTDRGRADIAIGAANRALGKPTPGGHPGNAFSSLFHQYNWNGTTGWEYWSRDYALMLKHALLTAASLGLPLHVHANCMDEVMNVAPGAGITFDFEVAKPVENPNDRDFHFINQRIASGDYFVLTDVVLPPSMPPAPEID